jgi:NitT/TauT family transport system substrate-binding protein
MLRSPALPSLLALLAFFVMLGAPGCSNEGRIPDITLGHAPHDHHAALFVAAEEPDYFREHGGIWLEELEPRQRYILRDGDRPLARLAILSGTGGSQLVRKLAERQLDLIFGGVPAAIKAMDQGAPLRILAPLQSEGAGLVLCKDLPAGNWEEFVRLARVAEPPLRIGYKTQGSVQDLIFETALKAEGVPCSRSLTSQDARVVLVDMHGAHNLIPGMRNGVIDGFVVMQPFVAKARVRLGATEVCSLGEMPPEGRWSGYPCCALIERDMEFSTNHPEAAAALVRLLRTAAVYLQEHPQESAELVGAWLGNDPAVERLSLPTIRFLPDFTPEWHHGVDFWVKTLTESGQLNGKIAEAFRNNTLEETLYDLRALDRAREVSP